MLRLSFRKKTKFSAKNIRTVRYGTETAYSIGIKIWSILPNDCKTSTVKECKIKAK